MCKAYARCGFQNAKAEGWCTVCGIQYSSCTVESMVESGLLDMCA